MNDLSFTAFKEALLDWPRIELPPPGPSTPGPLCRLWQVTEEGRINGSFASFPDLIVLVRQVLLLYGVDGTSERLSIPQGEGWPDVVRWSTFGFRVIKTGTRLVLEAEAWRPDWLGSGNVFDGDVFEDEHRAKRIRGDAGVAMDPFLRDVSGFDQYVCPGQREAILSALFMPAGNSLIVNLPTGSGKSLVAQAPVLVRGQNSGLTLVVVPTNALAMDLERRTQEILRIATPDHKHYDLAWIGSRSEMVGEAIKQRIRSGSQGILFASPEAVCGTLLNSLYSAAEKNLLAYLVIDEAHLVAQWGDAFRPAFQQLAGVRRGLLEAGAGRKFRTLLMSATFSQEVINTLKVLFGPADSLDMVSAVHLRPEPRYLSYQAKNSEDKRTRLEELILYVPRPFIFYTTTREDAKAWFKRLVGIGFRRIECVHGDTPNEKRERVIGDWVADRLDGIVATSAFGVGMDKSDVRSVIHAALPETLDRLYQEVGRGGRDGRASLSITLFDDRDVRVARRLSVPTLIGDDKGYERWSTLYREAERSSQDPGQRLVDLRKVPGGLTQESDYNRDWNMRTLILLARAGLIQIGSSKPLLIERWDGEDDASFEARFDAQQEDYFARIPVRSLDPRLMDRSHFDRQVGAERDRGVASANRAFDSMLEALRGDREMADVLVDLFASDSVVVSPACRGCPASHGATHSNYSLYQIPPGIGISQLAPYDYRAWRERFGDLSPAMVVVLCPPDTPSTSLVKALRAAVSALGLKELVIQREFRRSNPEIADLHRWSQDRVVVVRDFGDVTPGPDCLPLPRATVLLPWREWPFPDDLHLVDRPLHLVFVPSDVRDAEHPLRLYRDTAPDWIELEDFLRRLTQ